jgi:hypothetical protein
MTPKHLPRGLDDRTATPRGDPVPSDQLAADEDFETVTRIMPKARSAERSFGLSI